MSAIYRAVATATGGRNGNVRTEDGILDLQLSIPKELGGPGKPLPNPELLFAAGYAACFDNALLYAAGQEHLRPTSTQVKATVSLVRREPTGFGLAVALQVYVEGLASEDDASRLVARAHETCPYSAAIRGNVDVDLEVRVESPTASQTSNRRQEGLA
jgi:Ohr subfamily peroxiredoxin